jgi:formamidopyrimidine-DNA glycosylase
MPELPEVENFRRLLLPLVSNVSKLSVRITGEKPPRKFLTAEEAAALNENCYVKDVVRKGKQIAIVLDCIKKVRNKKRKLQLVGGNFDLRF